MAFFFVRLVGMRPDFAQTMSEHERTVMNQHFAYLQQELAAGRLVVAGPVVDPTGPYGMAVFEAESLDAMNHVLERDPATALGRHEIFAMGPAFARPARA